MGIENIKDQVQQFISEGADSGLTFNELAMRVFNYQYDYNPIYRKFCRKRRVSPRTIKHFSQIPAVPITAFKEALLSCSPMDKAEAVFMTSGTTNPEKRGKNVHQDLRTWEKSMTVNFKKFVMKQQDKVTMLLLFPTYQEMPNSSLAYYLQHAKQYFGTSESTYPMNEDGLDINELITLLRSAEETGNCVYLLGATFSFVHFLDYCTQHSITFNLPKGSTVLTTGGVKGKSREINPESFQASLCHLMNIEETSYINMYGMTELSSQFYNQDGKDSFYPPHWVQTLIVNPTTMKPCEIGERGIIVHYDLANINSVLALMTEDVGVKTNEGFKLLGRAKGAEAKGCSLAVEDFVSASRS